MDSGLLTVEEVAARLKVDKRLVYGLIQAGELAASKVGRAYRVQAESLEKYLRTQSTTKMGERIMDADEFFVDLTHKMAGARLEEQLSKEEFEEKKKVAYKESVEIILQYHERSSRSRLGLTDFGYGEGKQSYEFLIFSNGNQFCKLVFGKNGFSVGGKGEDSAVLLRKTNSGIPFPPTVEQWNKESFIKYMQYMLRASQGV